MYLLKKVLCFIITIAVGLCFATMMNTGCCTIMHGSSQDIGIQSKPTGAKVTIDNREFGKAPVIAKLSRKDNHTIHFTLEGYQPFDATVTRSTSGWVWGNIVFGGLIGLAVDAISGSLYKLRPEQVEGELVKQDMGSELLDCDIVVTVVLEPDPEWEMIGSLIPAN